MKRAGFFIAAAFCIAFLNTKGLAVSYTSAQSGNWNTNTTWTPQGIPSATDNVSISSAHTVTHGRDESVNNITMGNATLELTGSFILQVNGTLDCSAALTTDTAIENTTI